MGDRKNEQVRHLVDEVRRQLRVMADPDLDLALDRAAEHFRPFAGEIAHEVLEQARREIEDELRVRVRHMPEPGVLGARIEEWYDPERQGIHWSALADYLHERWGDEIVLALSHMSATVVSRLGNPRTREFDVRGLVVGHVQSGKTANMTAVIARAVDAGYDFVVVLAGITDNLRHQTQIRLQRDLVARNPYNWTLLTRENRLGEVGRVEESGEYRGMPARQIPRPRRDVAMLAVIKKHPSVIRRLREDIAGSLPLVKNELRMLVIDDEADQASPNTARPDDDPTATNREIRALLHALPAVSYVGYTATPFANVLINPFPSDSGDGSGQPDDLYPRDFIVSLPKPDGYFGAEEIFGRDPVNAEDEGSDGLDVIRDVPDPDADALRAAEGVSTRPLPESLRRAIRWFLLVVAARIARGQEHAHSTMLLHFSYRIEDHEWVAGPVRREVERLANAVGRSDGGEIDELHRLWEDECARVSAAAFGNRPIEFADLASLLAEAAGRLEIVVENSASPERLSYEGDAKAVIVIGGTMLSRGLTLEGLAVSYFLRASRQYDTLLQMGRWFGYREGYEDLIRVWMPESLAEDFRLLARVEREIRDEIGEYALRNATPLDFAVRIPTFPGLQVTARAKMYHARELRLDYRGQHVQTLRFAKCDKRVLEANWQAAHELAREIGIVEGCLVREADVGQVIRFLESYRVHPSHRDLDEGWILKYVRENAGILERWSVAVVQPRGEGGRRGEIPIGRMRPWLLRRSRLRGGPDEVADIKALMSRRDVLADLAEEELPEDRGWQEWDWDRLKDYREECRPDVPLLLLYPVDRESPPRKGSRTRLPLDAAHDVLGIGIVFPHLGFVGRSPSRWIEVRLPDREFEEEPDAEAAGGSDD